MKSKTEPIPLDMQERLTRLKERGYSCRYPNANLRPLRADGTGSHGAVYLNREGPWPQEIYLEHGTWTVLVVGGQDHPLEEFLQQNVAGWIDSVRTVKVLPGQRSLFGDEE